MTKTMTDFSNQLHERREVLRKEAEMLEINPIKVFQRVSVFRLSS